jgi:hypothetical protein
MDQEAKRVGESAAAKATLSQELLPDSSSHHGTVRLYDCCIRDCSVSSTIINIKYYLVVLSSLRCTCTIK